MLSKPLAIYSSVAFQPEVISLYLIARKGFLIHEFVQSVFEAIQRFGINSLLQ